MTALFSGAEANLEFSENVSFPGTIELVAMRIVSLIDEEDVLERILRHLGLWQEGVCVHCGTDPPGETTLDPWLDDPFPDYDTEPVVAFSAT